MDRTNATGTAATCPTTPPAADPWERTTRIRRRSPSEPRTGESHTDSTWPAERNLIRAIEDGSTVLRSYQSDHTFSTGSNVTLSIRSLGCRSSL